MEGTQQTYEASEACLSKVAAVSFSFWLGKALSTTLGETGGDALTVSMNLGYPKATLIFTAIFLAAVIVQVPARRFHRFLDWFTMVATTTVGTTMADLADRSGGLGYARGRALLPALVLGSGAVWSGVTGTVSVAAVNWPKSEIFYWVTIMFSQTPGAALGDWAADDAGLGYPGGVAVFGGVRIVVACLHFFTKISKTLLFWSAFILTRPLGARSGGLFDKPVAQGGMAISRTMASGVPAMAIVAWHPDLSSARGRGQGSVDLRPPGYPREGELAGWDPRPRNRDLGQKQLRMPH
jgi:uncharacterized membrane-anchored protein